MFETTQAVLTGRGFDAYEVSNHARGEAFRSRHNLAYWRGQDYAGVGPGAHGRLTLNGARTALRAAPKIAGYLARVSETGVGWDQRQTLTPREAAEERLLMGLRTIEGVALAEVAGVGLDVGDAKIRELADAGFLALENGRLIATPAGRLVLDRITVELATAAQSQGS